MESVLSVLESRVIAHRTMREQTSLVTVVAMENELQTIVTMIANELNRTNPEQAKRFNELSLKVTA